MKYKYFTEHELKCKHCKAKLPESEWHTIPDNMDPQFMEFVMALRERCAFAFIVTSAYRCKDHEAEKGSPGAHTTGKAIDIKVSGVKAYKLLKAAMDMGFLGIGVNQKGPEPQRYIHVDMWTEGPRPAVWNY